MGYLIHVLTDIMCDKIYQEEIYPELLNKGYNTNEIIEMLNVKIASIYYYAKKNKIKIKKKYTGGKNDKIILEGIQSGKTQKEIASILGVSASCVQQRVKALANEEARKLKINE